MRKIIKGTIIVSLFLILVLMPKAAQAFDDYEQASYPSKLELSAKHPTAIQTPWITLSTSRLLLSYNAAFAKTQVQPLFFIATFKHEDKKQDALTTTERAQKYYQQVYEDNKQNDNIVLITYDVGDKSAVLRVTTSSKENAVTQALSPAFLTKVNKKTETYKVNSTLKQTLLRLGNQINTTNDLNLTLPTIRQSKKTKKRIKKAKQFQENLYATGRETLKKRIQFDGYVMVAINIVVLTAAISPALIAIVKLMQWRRHKRRLLKHDS